MHEKTNRLRFLEACLLREMVARDGLTGIQNRRMFDQHIARVWQQAVREEERIAVLLADVDCSRTTTTAMAIRPGMSAYVRSQCL